MCVTITRFVYYFKPRYIGILIIHFGLLMYLISAFVIFHVSVESNVHLMEHEGTNVSASYHQWELASWNDSGKIRTVTAYDVDHLAAGTRLKFHDGSFGVVVKQYYPNAHAYLVTDENKRAEAVINSSGIALLQPQEVLKEREKNIAGGIFEINIPGQKSLDVLLYGSDPKPTSVTIGNTNYLFRLQHKKYQLPLTIELLDFRVQFHPGTQTAKSYESTVRITHDGVSRDVVISMNNPLMYKDYTFFQASYAIDSFGNEYSTFAVVKNFGRFLPYVASLVTFAGLALHFLMMAFAVRKKRGVS
jgi:cytochrome c biogenesis protein ResB